MLRLCAIVSTAFAAGSLGITSGCFIPALLRPLRRIDAPATKSSPSVAKGTDGLPPPSLSAPEPTIESGRLTPQASIRDFDLDARYSSDSSDAYTIVAKQFVFLETRLAAITTLTFPLALFGFGGLAIGQYRQYGRSGLGLWAAGFGLVASAAMLSQIHMSPLVHKTARIAGDEEKIEPYEDAPIDREAEKSNTIDFIERWHTLNAWRTLLVASAFNIALLTGSMPLRWQAVSKGPWD